MNKKIVVASLSLLTSLGVIALISYFWTQNNTKKNINYESTPTFFFHGGGSNYHAEDTMVQAAKKAGGTNTVIVANVDKKGQVTLSKTISQGAKNPIIKINYEDNRQTNFNKAGEYATSVVNAVRSDYKFEQMNMLGHSLGNISIMYYMLQNATNKQMPKLVKQVDIAGHFAGLRFKNLPLSIVSPDNLTVDRDGKPNEMNATYQQMTALRDLYPKGQVQVLNIIGNIGDDTDGTVENASTKSLKYLLGDRPKSYKEIMITGKNAKHSSLHENSEVNKLLVDFLWGK